MRHAADQNQSGIIDALRRAGCSVQPLSQVGDGCPDLLVGMRGENHLLEVKRAKSELSHRQVVWHQFWRGKVKVVRTVQEALKAVGL